MNSETSAAIHQEPAMPPQRPRPVPVTVLGILNIVFGSLGILAYLCAGIGILFFINVFYGPSGKGNKDLTLVRGIMEVSFESSAQHIPYYWAFLIGSLVLSVVLTLVLLITGIGLLRMRPWGRVGAIAYSVIAILAGLMSLFYTIL